MKSIIAIAILGIILIGTPGCYYDKEDILYPSPCDTTNVTYSQSITPIVNTYCLTCHSATAYKTLGGSVNLEGYTNMITSVQNGTLLKAIKHESAYPMPKNQTPLSTCNIAKIEKWIGAGAPNN